MTRFTTNLPGFPAIFCNILRPGTLFSHDYVWTGSGFLVLSTLRGSKMGLKLPAGIVALGLLLNILTSLFGTAKLWVFAMATGIGTGTLDLPPIGTEIFWEEID